MPVSNIDKVLMNGAKAFERYRSECVPMVLLVQAMGMSAGDLDPASLYADGAKRSKPGTQGETTHPPYLGSSEG